MNMFDLYNTIVGWISFVVTGTIAYMVCRKDDGVWPL